MKHKRLHALYLSMRRADLPLKNTARHMVFGEGDPDASLMFIGEAPGRTEDEKGRPFVGPAGRELNRLLDAIDCKRDEIYITSILKYRPPENRNPRMDEIMAHAPYLMKQISIIEPEIIVPMGNFAAHCILSLFGGVRHKNISKISGCHGRIFRVVIDSRPCKVIPIHHPAAVLYNRALAGVMKADFIKIKKAQKS
jgi:uracil-DNA glycosylase family 4